MHDFDGEERAMWQVIHEIPRVDIGVVEGVKDGCDGGRAGGSAGRFG